MKNLLKTPILLLSLLLCGGLGAQTRDTLTITPKNLSKREIEPSQLSYIVYNKVAKDSSAEKIYLVNIKLALQDYKGHEAIAITQRWERDSIFHTALTILDANNYSTLWHEFYWKAWGFPVEYDFINKQLKFGRKIPDSIYVKYKNNFLSSLDKYSLNWHSDLFIFTLLPYRANRTFKINFYDPGFGTAREVYYSVVGSETLQGPAGNEIPCWILHYSSKPNTYHNFWIDKETHLVVKEEDRFSNSKYRFKILMAVSEKKYNDQ